MAGLASRSVSLSHVASTREVRIDPHFFVLQERIQPIAFGIRRGFPISTPFVRDVNNGLNLPEACYDIAAEVPDFLYLSVGGFSQFSLRKDRCTPLKDPTDYEYATDLASHAARKQEVLVGRSGTPGIAWPVCAHAELAESLIPSGFVVRIDCEGSSVAPTYLAAILNHPVWRVWSSSLAAGKRQRNLSQDHLAQLIVPSLSLDAQERVGSEYIHAVRRVEAMQAAQQDLMDLCDEILRDVCGLSFPRLSFSTVSVDDVHLTDCCQSPVLRMDARFHRSEVRLVLDSLRNVPRVVLKSLLIEPIVKGRQPPILDVDDPDNLNRVVATVSLQHGQVMRELTKPTTEEAVERDDARHISPGHLLVAMDGEGSIGKAAVFDADYDAIPDSHVAILNAGNAELAEAVACFINSSLGQAQVELAISGATGQTQLAPTDLAALVLPKDLIQNASKIATRFRTERGAYEAISERVRREICRTSLLTSNALIEANVLSKEGREFLLSLQTEESLYGLLGSLEPEMF